MQWTDTTSSMLDQGTEEKGVSCNSRAARCLWRDCQNHHQGFVSGKQMRKLLKAETLGFSDLAKVIIILLEYNLSNVSANSPGLLIAHILAAVNTLCGSCVLLNKLLDQRTAG